MTAPNRPPLCDPVDRPESYPLGVTANTPDEQFRARATLRRCITDDTERLQFLQMLGLAADDTPARSPRQHRRTAA
ncbi:hypothetical protein [Kitasatospora sp. NBC_01302]|uniref:hypothetical protein n=1 Tax=Kitasatospora sp. NBC_01302 TaxID=2903575 RepID=UPI002E15C87A|nr:hypothetical protein OG294_13780 [Kitasatospora sp. NBC_01302]